jgi:hypothetical protein
MTDNCRLPQQTTEVVGKFGRCDVAFLQENQFIKATVQLLAANFDLSGYPSFMHTLARNTFCLYFQGDPSSPKNNQKIYIPV